MSKNPAGASDNSVRHDLSGELSEALAQGQFFLVYQPTIDLQTNAFAGVEALIRWRHPERGVLTPDAFIDELEADDEILPVGRWALQTACAQGAVWHDRGYRFTVSVNIARRQLESDEFRDDVADALSSSRYDPALLVLEFTQGTLLSNKESSSFRVKQLKSLGIRIAVDDFEPGESALDELQTFDVDIVKLGREFIAAISTSSEATGLVHGLVQLSDSRHVQVIAAGIEDSDQRTRLADEKVHVGQGFLFSEPHEADEIDRYLEDFAIFSGKPL
jgi:EAL domain-containing protein (putative c-di-GMP-specific phosphodiesterase class I)